MNELDQIKHRLREFTRARDWEQLMCMDIRMPWVHGRTGAAHSPKNLSMALSAEVAEILEHLTNHGCSNVACARAQGWAKVEQRRSSCRGRTGATQWLTEEQSNNLPQDKLAEVEMELADTLIYLTRLADRIDIDLLKAVVKKIEINEQKYPVDKAKGNAIKYTELGK